MPDDDVPLYRRISDEMLFDPLPDEPPPVGAGAGWCEDRDPQSDWELTDLDGRE